MRPQGQDGEYLVGISPGYLDNGDGTITDSVTGLMWEKLSNDGSVHEKDTQLSWTDGLAKIATLNSSVFAGHNDWRLPNVRELETLVNFVRDFPTATNDFNTTCTAGCTVLTCNCTRSFSHWTSTTYDSDRACAWSIDFSIGTRSGLPKTSLSTSARFVAGSSYPREGRKQDSSSFEFGHDFAAQRCKTRIVSPSSGSPGIDSPSAGR